MREELSDLTGRFLTIDLENRSYSYRKLDNEMLRKYLGGVGIAAKILYDEIPAGIGPLSPDNRLFIATGPLSLQQVPGGGSIDICFKSPLTGAWGEARLGSDYGFAMKRAGFDHLMFRGRSPFSVYVVIDNDNISFRDAGHIEGLRVLEREQQLRSELEGEDFQILTIGPAGENLVPFATIMNGHRAAGRCGGGAVMGSKNLLAIAVRGDGSIPIMDREAFMEEIRNAHGIVRSDPSTPFFTSSGTMGGLEHSDRSGDFPTRNWASNSWGNGEKIAEHFFSRNQIKAKGCYTGCPARCGRKVHVPDGPYKTPEHDGGEYESIAAFTGFIFNDDVDAAVHISYLCNEYGLDTISTGAVTGFFMECREKGLLHKRGMEQEYPEWAKVDDLPDMVRKIAFREGLGDIMARGVKAAAEYIGEGAEEFAIHCKGLEGPAHDPRSGKCLALAYGTGNRGMCHIHPVEAKAYDSEKIDFGLQPYGLPDPALVGRWQEAGKGQMVKILQDGCVIPDVIGTCKFYMYMGLDLEIYARILAALTGENFSGLDLLTVGERVNNLQRLFNIREGFTRKDDYLPQRVLHVPAFGNYSRTEDCAIKDYDAMLDEYYLARGWGSNGIPSASKLKELGI
jgi:aldehyde:ferredoxin oxidoreductase